MNGIFVAGTSASSPGVPRHMFVFVYHAAGYTYILGGRGIQELPSSPNPMSEREANCGQVFIKMRLL